MTKVKIVKFYFFRPVVKRENQDILIDLRNIFEQIRLQYQNGRDNDDENYKIVYNYNNEPARLADIAVDVETSLYHLVFERLNYHQLPSKTTLHGDSQAVELEEDEYIGFDVNVLYDPADHVLMIQRNRDSLGPTGIEYFLNTTLHKYANMNGAQFSLSVITDENVKKRAINQKAYRKLHFKVTGAKANGIIERLTGRNDDLGIDNIEIILNCKPNKTAEIDQQYARQLLEEYVEDEDVQKLRIRAREAEDSPVEAIDLFDHKLQASSEFVFISERYLNPISVFEKMKNDYLSKYRSLIRRVCWINENL